MEEAIRIKRKSRASARTAASLVTGLMTVTSKRMEAKERTTTTRTETLVEVTRNSSNVPIARSRVIQKIAAGRKLLMRRRVKLQIWLRRNMLSCALRLILVMMTLFCHL
jgi:hypothetical protein